MFGARLRALRKSRNFTQSQLAKLLYISPSAVGMYEQGRRRPDSKMLLSICGLFGVSLDYLIGRSADELPADDIGVLFESIRAQLLVKSNVFFNGRALTSQEIEKLFDAMYLTVNLVLSRSQGQDFGPAGYGA